MKGALKNCSNLSKILLFLGLIIAFMLASIAVWAMIYGTDQSSESLRVLQMLNCIGIFILPPIVYSFLCKEQPSQFLQISNGASTKHIAATVGIAILAIPFINLLSHLNQAIELPTSMNGIETWMRTAEANAANLVEQFLRTDKTSIMFFNIFLMAILPGIGEELFFRGTLQNTIQKKYSIHWAIWISTIIFSAIHLQFYGFIPRMLMGAAFGYLLVWSGSLWLPIIAHFTNNACAVIIYYIVEKKGLDTDMIETFGTGNTTWIAILCGIATLQSLYLLRRSLTMSSASSRKSMGN